MRGEQDALGAQQWRPRVLLALPQCCGRHVGHFHLSALWNPWLPCPLSRTIVTTSIPDFLLSLLCGNPSVYSMFTLHCISSLSAPDRLTPSLWRPIPLSPFSLPQLPLNIPSYFPFCLFSSHSRARGKLLPLQGWPPHLSLLQSPVNFPINFPAPLGTISLLLRVHFFPGLPVHRCWSHLQIFWAGLELPSIFYSTKTSLHQTFCPLEMHLEFRTGATKYICVSISSPPRFIPLFLSSVFSISHGIAISLPLSALSLWKTSPDSHVSLPRTLASHKQTPLLPHMSHVRWVTHLAIHPQIPSL